MATTVNLRSGANLGWVNQGFAGVLTQIVNFVTGPAVNTDLRQLFDLKLGMILAATITIDTPESGTATVDLVTTETSPQTILDDGDITGAAGTVLTSDASAGTGALRFFPILNDCILNMLVNNAATSAGIVTVRLYVMGAQEVLS